MSDEYRILAKPVMYDFDRLFSIDDQRRNYCLTPRQAELASTALYRQAQWRTRWLGDNLDFDASQNLVANTIYNLSQPCPPPSDLPSFLDVAWDGYGWTINIQETCMPITVNIYEGCCGDSSTTTGVSDGSPLALGDGGGSVALSSQASRCDVVTSTVPYILQQMNEYLASVQNLVDGGLDFFDAFVGGTSDIFDPTDVSGSAIEFLTDTAGENLNNIIQSFSDSDFTLLAQVRWWGVRQEPTVTELTRGALREWARAMPWTFGNPVNGTFFTPRPLIEALVNVIDVGKINRNVFLSRGSADAALCEYLASQNGQTYVPAPALPPPGSTLPARLNQFPAGGGDILSVWQVPNMTYGISQPAGVVYDLLQPGELVVGYAAWVTLAAASVGTAYQNIATGEVGSIAVPIPTQYPERVRIDQDVYGTTTSWIVTRDGGGGTPDQLVIDAVDAANVLPSDPVLNWGSEVTPGFDGTIQLTQTRLSNGVGGQLQWYIVILTPGD